MKTIVKPDDFQRLSRDYNSDPRRSLSLQAEAYVDPKWFELDQQSIIAKSWQWVCHVEKVREPGSYVATTIAGKPVAIVRDREGVILDPSRNARRNWAMFAWASSSTLGGNDASTSPAMNSGFDREDSSRKAFWLRTAWSRASWRTLLSKLM